MRIRLRLRQRGWKISSEAKEKGLNKLTMWEIDSEISAAR